MTTEKIIALAKEKLGKEITEQEAQDYLDGKISLPDEILEIVSGGGCSSGTPTRCPNPDCNSDDILTDSTFIKICKKCRTKIY